MLNLRRLFQQGSYQVVTWTKCKSIMVTPYGKFFTTQKTKQTKKSLFKKSQKIVTNQTQSIHNKQQSSLLKNKPKQQEKKTLELKFSTIPLSTPIQEISLNPTQSLHSHIMRIRSIDSFAEFYTKHKQYFSPRLLSISSRTLCSLCEKQKTNKISSQVLKKLQAFLSDLYTLVIGTKREQIKNQQLKNILYFTKKSLNELANLFGLNPQNEITYNKNLYQKAVCLKNQLTNIFLSKDFGYTHYEVNQIVEIYYELIRLSAQNQTPKIYEAILKNKQKIQETANPQFLFSTGNFLLSVKTIEMQQMNSNKNFDANDKKDGKLFSRQKTFKSKNQRSKELINLREQCYRIFLNKWLYYYDDMSEFIKLQDLKHSWPLILQSYTGVKLLLQSENGFRAIKIISRILDIHNCKYEEILLTNIRILGNSHILLELLAIQLADPNEITLNSYRKQSLQKISTLSGLQRSRLKLRMKSFLQTLRRKNIIETKTQKQIIEKVQKI